MMSRFTRSLRHRLEAALARGVIAAVGMMPLACGVRAGAALGWVAFHVVRVRRSTVLENIRGALPQLSEHEITRVAERCYSNLGRSLFEFAAFARLDAGDIERAVEVEGLEYFDAALRHGRGAVLFTGHFGNWELLGAVVARRGYPLHVTDTRHTNPRTHRVISALRERQGVEVISPEEPAGRVLSLLARNRFVAYLADQDARGAGVFVDFFGRPAWTLRAPAVLALRRGCPVVPGFIVRVGARRHRAVFGPPMWPDPALSGREAVVELTQRFTHLLEDAVRHHPDHYFWAHRRWKTRPGREPARTRSSDAGPS